MNAPRPRIPWWLAGLCACQAAPELPRLAASRPFAVGYQGYLAAAGIVPPLADPAPAPLSRDQGQVEVRLTLLELPTADVGRLVPALLEPMAAPATVPAAAVEPRRLEPRRGDRSAPPETPRPAVTRSPNGSLATATLRGVHLAAPPLRAVLEQLVATERAKVLDDLAFSCAEGAETAAAVLQESPLVQQIQLVPGGAAAYAFDFAVAPVQHGAWVQVQPRRDVDGSLQLGVHLQLRSLVLPVPIQATRYGMLHLPTLAVQELRTLEPVAPHDALVLGSLCGSTPDTQVLAILELQVGASPIAKGARR